MSIQPARHTPRRPDTSITARTAHRPGTCITRLPDWPARPNRRGRAMSLGIARPDEGTVTRGTGRAAAPTAKGIRHTDRITATEARATSRLTAGARAPSAVDAHLDGGRDLPDRF